MESTIKSFKEFILMRKIKEAKLKQIKLNALVEAYNETIFNVIFTGGKQIQIEKLQKKRNQYEKETIILIDHICDLTHQLERV